MQQGGAGAAREDLTDAPVTRGADEDQVGPDLLGQLVQAARRRAARRGLGLGADGLRGSLDLARVLDLRVAEVRVVPAPDRVELEHAGGDELGAGRVGELLAEREGVLCLVAVVIADEDLAVHIGLLWPGYRPAAMARSKSLSTPSGN